jgi:magnesium chelatase family protein
MEPVEAEVEVSQGLPAVNIVGLADAGVQEARERIRSALVACGIAFPRTRITVNLAPADTRKSGSHFDLPIALALAAHADPRLAEALARTRILAFGELSLDGRLRKSAGLLNVGALADELKASAVFVPAENAQEAVRFSKRAVYASASLEAVLRHIKGEGSLPRVRRKKASDEREETLDFLDVRGQEFAKRGLLIAAAGGHNIRMEGPPGAGKTLLARALPSILPRMSDEETYAVSLVYSALGLLDNRAPVVAARPFRSPHHTATLPALLGGGQPIRPGEISLAHRGVLFLDELPEFERRALEALRQPLEEGVITVSRAEGHARFPAEVILVAAHNPCPCGFANDPERACTCSVRERERYRKKLSGPILDRIDLHIRMPRLTYEKLRGARGPAPQSSRALRAKVEDARERQRTRFARESWETNSAIPHRATARYLALDEESELLLKGAMNQYQLSARAVSRLLKISRTIADLSGSSAILLRHLAEALQYRVPENRSATAG